MSAAELEKEKENELDSNVYHKIKDENQQEDTNDSLDNVRGFDQTSKRRIVDVQIEMGKGGWI